MLDHPSGGQSAIQVDITTIHRLYLYRHNTRFFTSTSVIFLNTASDPMIKKMKMWSLNSDILKGTVA